MGSPIRLKNNKHRDYQELDLLKQKQTYTFANLKKHYLQLERSCQYIQGTIEDVNNSLFERLLGFHLPECQRS
jgi:hypothetical protein